MTNFRTSVAVRFAAKHARALKRSINFNETIKSSETAIFLMPWTSVEFYLARSVVESLMRYFRRVVLVVSDNMRDVATYRSELIVVSKADEGWLKLPSHDLISRLKRENYDIAFDLSFSEDIFMSYLCRKSDAKISAGFSKANGDHFYDLQIRVPEDGDMKKAYESLINTIKMFKEK